MFVIRKNVIVKFDLKYIKFDKVNFNESLL